MWHLENASFHGSRVKYGALGLMDIDLVPFLESDVIPIMESALLLLA